MSTWLDQLVADSQNRLGTGGWSSSDPEAWEQRAAATNDAYRQAITAPVAGAEPLRSNYLSLIPASYTNDTLTKAGYRFDSGAYASDLYSFMRGQEKYADWSDADIKSFIGGSLNMTDDQKRAEELWTDSSIAYRKAQKDAEADRNAMLGELATYKDTVLSSTWVDDLVGQEAGRWNARNQGILNQVAQQTANMGRTVSPYLLGDLARRLQAQASAAIQEVRVSAEQQQEQRRQYYLSTLNSVYSNTKREVMDPITAAAMIKQSAAAGGGSARIGGGSTVNLVKPVGAKTKTSGTYVDMDGFVHTYVNPSGSYTTMNGDTSLYGKYLYTDNTGKVKSHALPTSTYVDMSGNVHNYL